MPNDTVAEKISSMGLVLPGASKPVAAYIPCRRAGNLLFIAGQIPMREGSLVAKGSVPGQVPVEKALECARQCVLNGLAVIKNEIGSLDRVKQFVRLGVFVCSESGFYEQPRVANGASELVVELFGEKGKHARAAVGSVALPLGAPVEVEFIVEVE